MSSKKKKRKGASGCVLELHTWWGMFLRVLWTARRSNPSILKEISPEYSLEGLMLKLKLQYFSHPMWRTDSLEKTLMLGKIDGRKRRGQQRMGWLDGITYSMNLGLSKLQKLVMNQEAWHTVVHGVTKRQTRLSNWTELSALSISQELGRVNLTLRLLRSFSCPISFLNDVLLGKRKS